MNLTKLKVSMNNLYFNYSSQILMQNPATQLRF